MAGHVNFIERMEQILDNDEILECINNKDWFGLTKFIGDGLSENEYTALACLCWNAGIDMPLVSNEGDYYSLDWGTAEALYTILKPLGIEKLRLPKEIKTIIHDCFNGCDLEDVILPDDLRFIGNHGFANTKLEEIDIPDSVIQVGWQCFENCTKLKRVKLPKNNEFSTIGPSCFRGCIHLESIDIPDSVNSIYGGAFYGCLNLKKVNLPSNLRFIHKNSFLNIHNACDISYDGTVEKFRGVNKEPGSFTENQIIHCTDGDYTCKG